MQLIKFSLLCTTIIGLNIVNIVDFDLKNILFFLITIIFWIISIPNFKEDSKTHKIVSTVCFIAFLIFSYFSINWKYWYPFEMWGDDCWLFIPILIFIISKIINLKCIKDWIEDSKIRIILTYIIVFVFLVGCMQIIYLLFDNMEATMYLGDTDLETMYLGLISSILFIYQLYKFFDIKINIDIKNIIVICLTLLIICSINISEQQKINSYIVSNEKIISLFSSNQLKYDNISKKLGEEISVYNSVNMDWIENYEESYFTFYSDVAEVRT